MVGNLWYDRRTGDPQYNIEDPTFPLLPSRDDVSKGGQLDPAQQAVRAQQPVDGALP